MGARRKGDVTLLCEIARPDVVVVTNVGVAHLEVFGSWEAIVEASAEPIDALGPEGVGVLNADDPVVAGYAARADGRVVTFGMSASADVRADGVQLDADGFAAFDRRRPRARRAHVALSVAGEHMVSNALASIAVGLTLGIELETAAAAVSTAARVALADGDLHDRRGGARGERRVQREPRVRGRGAQGRPVDGRATPG